MAAKKSEESKQPAAENQAHSETTASGAQIKKVRPYPFEVKITLKEGVPPVACLVLKLTPVGFLMRAEQSHHFKVGDNHQAQFELPVTHAFFNEGIKIIKTYDSMDVAGAKELVKHLTIEAHFRQLNQEKKKHILKFLEMIKQK